MWVPGRWALSAFQVALVALAIFMIVKRRGRVGWHPVPGLLAGAAAWGFLQIALHQTAYAWRTSDAVLNCTVNLIAFSVAACLATSRQERERFLRAILIFAFALSIVAIFTVLTSPPDKVFWFFDVGTGSPTLGPFVYRNQYAAFVEAVPAPWRFSARLRTVVVPLATSPSPPRCSLPSSPADRAPDRSSVWRK